MEMKAAGAEIATALVVIRSRSVVRGEKHSNLMVAVVEEGVPSWPMS